MCVQKYTKNTDYDDGWENNLFYCEKNDKKR